MCLTCRENYGAMSEVVWSLRKRLWSKILYETNVEMKTNLMLWNFQDKVGKNVLYSSVKLNSFQTKQDV